MLGKLLAVAALCAAGLTGFAFDPPEYNGSFTRQGVTYAQRGGLGARDYVVTNIVVNGQPRPLPPYLYLMELDDTYPDDAEWYYQHADYRDGGHCSVRRSGNTVERNYDWHFDDAATFVLKVGGAEGRFASVGVANVGTNLTDSFVLSGAWSRYYKCLAGHTTDGINENGLVAEVNVTSGSWGRNSGAVHGLGAVRWALDHGTNAQQAAEFLAANVYLPQGFGVNFHYLIADATKTYIVENCEAHEVTNAPAVMTNFNLDRQGGEGYERHASLTGGATIESQWWTLAYNPATRPVRSSDLGGEAAQIWAAWNDGRTKEQHRGESFSGVTWWQTVHCSKYDIPTLTLRIAVQEIPDWYAFTVPTVGKVKSVNGRVGEVELEAADVGAVADDDDYQSVKSKATTAVQPAAIADMETRTHAAETYQPKGDYLTEEEDPTVADWAKKPNPAPVTDLTPATNYTDAVTNAIAAQYVAGDYTIVTNISIWNDDYTRKYANYLLDRFDEDGKTFRAWSFTVRNADGSVTKNQKNAARGWKIERLGDIIGTVKAREVETKGATFGTLSANSISNIVTGAYIADRIVLPQEPRPEHTLTANGKSVIFNASADLEVEIPELPEKWALANVTNATGGAVSAADVGAYGKSNSFHINDRNGISVGSDLTDEHSSKAEIDGGSLTFFNGYGGSTRFDPYGYIWSSSGGMWQFPIGISGTVMVESWQSLYRAFDIISTNATARTSVGTKMMTLISDHEDFSNAVLAVQVSTNDFAALYELKAAFADLPIDPVTGGISIGALLAALASAVAWLKKNKVGSFSSVGGASATVENGVAKLDDFFKEENTLLTGVIDARLPYPLNAVTTAPGLLKDRALNTTSLASVTVPDTFTDLLIRASVATGGSLPVTMPTAITTKYGDTFPDAEGEYLITITKTGAAEAYVRTIKLEVANA